MRETKALYQGEPSKTRPSWQALLALKLWHNPVGNTTKVGWVGISRWVRTFLLNNLPPSCPPETQTTMEDLRVVNFGLFFQELDHPPRQSSQGYKKGSEGPPHSPSGMSQ